MRPSRRYRKRYKKRKTRRLRGGNLPLIEVPFFTERRNKDAPKEIQDIPLVIYQSWKTRDVPPKMKECIDKLKANNPEFDHYLYSDEDCLKFIQDNFDKSVVDAFNTLKPGAYKSDLWRYCILYKLGGVYLDIKFYTTTPLKNLILSYNGVFVKDIQVSSQGTGGGCEAGFGIYNGFIISQPDNNIFKECIDDIVESCRLKRYKDGFLGITGPCLLASIIKKYRTQEEIDNIPYSVVPINKITYNRATIVLNGNVIAEEYEEYRDEQNKTKQPSYGVLWKNRDVYNE